MKTAEEWIKELDALPPHPEHMTVEWRTATTKAIQLDALNEAAEIDKKWHDSEPIWGSAVPKTSTDAILARIKEVEGCE